MKDIQTFTTTRTCTWMSTIVLRRVKCEDTVFSELAITRSKQHNYVLHFRYHYKDRVQNTFNVKHLQCSYLRIRDILCTCDNVHTR